MANVWLHLRVAGLDSQLLCGTPRPQFGTPKAFIECNGADIALQ